MSQKPTATVPEASCSVSESQGIYRFWSNERITAAEIRASHRIGVEKRVREQEIVLAIQDTTELNYTSHKQTQGLGYINQTKQQGIKVHSCIAVSPQGEPLGLLHQECWNRQQAKGKRAKRKKVPIEQKESYRWLRTQKAAEKGLAAAVKMIHVGDREADLFELFAQDRQPDSELLIRLTHNRKVQHEMGYLIPALEQAPVMGETQIQVARNPQRPERTAHLQVRGMEVTLAVPQNHLNKALKPVTLNVLLVEETVTPTDGGAPIRWLLATTLPLTTGEQVWQCVYWYSLRWLIERFHYTLKSGCGVEQLQLQTAQRLIKALATYSIVAWHLLQLTYLARLTPDASCERFFLPHEWRLLRRHFSPMSRARKPPSLHQMLVWIARLGGFLARKGDGEPGVKVLWRGLKVFAHFIEGAQLLPLS